MNYQERVSTRADVRALYEKVIANPAIKEYRGYTESKSYGWDAEVGDYIKRDGEAWFPNPAFDESFVPEGESGGNDADLLDEKLGECEQQIKELERLIGELEDENELQGMRVADAEARAAAAARERDEAKEALAELCRALSLVMELAGVKNA